MIIKYFESMEDPCQSAVVVNENSWMCDLDNSYSVLGVLDKSAFVSTKIKKCLGFTFTTQRVLIQKQNLSNSTCTSTSRSSSFQ